MTVRSVEQSISDARAREPQGGSVTATGLAPASIIRQAVRALPAWLKADIKDEQLTVCHAGCGEGKLSEAVQEAVGVPIVAIDTSEDAIADARRRYPSIRFRTYDWSLAEDLQFDVIVQARLVESQGDLPAHLETFAKHASRHLVAVLPLPPQSERESSAVRGLGKVPLILGRGLVLTSMTFANGRSGDAPTLTAVTLVYSDPGLSILRGVTLTDALEPWVDAASSPQEAAARGREVERLSTDLTRLRERLAMSERDVQSAHALAVTRQTELEHAKQELWALQQQDAELREELSRMQASRSWQITKPMRQVIGATRAYTDQMQAIQAKISKLSFRELKNRLDHLLDAPDKDREPQTTGTRKRFATFGQSQPLFPETVVMFALVPFDDVGGGQRSAQLARVLTARGYRVVYVYLYKKYNFTTQRYEDSHIDLPRLTHLHIDEVTPLTVLQNVAPGSTAIFEAPHPRYEIFFDTCRKVGLRTVFELIDAWDTSLGGDWYQPEVMSRFVRESDLAVGTAHALVDNLKSHGRKDPVYLPNAGNEQLFDLTATYERPRDMEVASRSLVYVGSLYGEWFAWDHVTAAANASPQTIIYLIGDPPKDKRMPANVRFLGPRPIEQVPAYLAHADAALLPFTPGKISDAVSPIKIFEYLFMGKPVISTDLPEIRGYPNVHIASSAEHFGRLCADINGTDSRPERFIMAHSWAQRADKLLGLKMHPQTSLVVTGDASAEVVRRLFESLRVHATAHVTEVVWLCGDFESKLLGELTQGGPKVVTLPERAHTLLHAWDLAKAHCTSDVVGFVDVNQWFTSRGVFDEAHVLLKQRATVGAVSAGAGWVTRGTLDMCSLENRQAQAHPVYRQLGYRTDVAYLQKSGLFARRALLDRLKLEGAAWDGSTFEMPEISFQLRELGFELAWRELTGLRAVTSGVRAKATAEQAEQFTNRWQHRPDLFLSRPPV